MTKKGSKKVSPHLESNENQYKNDDESEIPYRRSLIIQQFNDFKLKIQNQEEQIKESRDEIKNKEEQLENEIKIRNGLNSKIFECERRINDLESINIFQKNEIDKKDKKIKLLNQEIIILKSKKNPSNDFADQEVKDMIDHLSKELDEKDLEIMKLNSKIQSLISGKTPKGNKVSNKEDVLYSDDPYSENNGSHQTKKNTNQINKQNFNKLSNVDKSNSRATPSSNFSPSKSSASNYINSKNERFESKNKTYKKVKKVNSNKPLENYEINNDVMAETKVPAHEPHYKSKSPPKLDIPSISISQRLITPTPTNNENHEANDEYDEEEDLPNTSRSAYPQNKNNIIGGRRNTNIIGENNKRKLERDFKSDDDVIKPKRAPNKRIIRKKKTIKRQTLRRTVNSKEDDSKNILNEKNQNESDGSNSNLCYSEHSQSIKNKRKTIKKTTKRIRRKNSIPAQIDSDSEKNEKSKTQQVLASKQNLKNMDTQKKTKMVDPKEPLPNINFDESEDNDYQSSDEQSQSKSNVHHPVRSKKVTRKVIRKRVINKGELAKTNNGNLNKANDENENEIDTNNNNNNKKCKKRRVIKRKIISTNDKAKASTNLINNNDNESSGSLDSNGVSPSQKLLAIQSMNKDNLNEKDLNNGMPTPGPNATKSKGKTKPRSKSKTVNISKPQTNLLNNNNNNNDQAQLKQQQSQPQMNNNQVKPQNGGEGATIASRAAWLNNELFGQQNSNNENLEHLFEQVVATNRAIVRNPRRGVNRRPPTILNDV